MAKIDFRKNNTATIKNITVACPCGKNHRIDPRHVRWYMRGGDCERCGAHGEITMEFWCPHNLDTPLRSIKVVVYDY